MRLWFTTGRCTAIIVACAMTAASCSRMGGSERQIITESEKSRRIQDDVLRCATEAQEKALEACRNAVRSGLLDTGMAFPDSQVFYERVGRVLVEERQYDAALHAYREGLSRYPENSRLHYLLGHLLIGQFGAHEEAYGPLLEAVRWNAQSKEALTLLGEVQGRLRRYDESTASYEAALRLDPRYADALVGLGRALRSQRRAPDAVAPLARAVEIAPENGFAYEQLGGALLDSGRPSEAVGPLQRAAKLLDDPRDAYCMLSTALANVGRDKESREACELARKPRRSHRGEALCPC